MSGNPLTDPIESARHETFAGIEIDVMSAGPVRVKRLVYRPGFRWSVDMKPHVDSDRCMHAHVGFLAQGSVDGEYADGCTFSFTAPEAVYVEPGHDSWVIGDEDAVLIQVDFADETLGRMHIEPHSHT